MFAHENYASASALLRTSSKPVIYMPARVCTRKYICLEHRIYSETARDEARLLKITLAPVFKKVQLIRGPRKRVMIFSRHEKIQRKTRVCAFRLIKIGEGNCRTAFSLFLFDVCTTMQLDRGLGLSTAKFARSKLAFSQLTHTGRR